MLFFEMQRYPDICLTCRNVIRAVMDESPFNHLSKDFGKTVDMVAVEDHLTLCLFLNSAVIYFVNLNVFNI